MNEIRRVRVCVVLIIVVIGGYLAFAPRGQPVAQMTTRCIKVGFGYCADYDPPFMKV